MTGNQPVDYIALTRAQYDDLGYPAYQWAERPDTPPWTPLAAPLADSTVALIGSGGAYRSGQVAFHWKDDTGIRHIPTSEPATDIRVTHFAYDLEPAREDPNIVFPVDRLRELVDEPRPRDHRLGRGRIGVGQEIARQSRQAPRGRVQEDRRGQRIILGLQRHGIGRTAPPARPAQIDRLRAPIGLAIPARSPWEVAVSVIAEVIAARGD